MSAVDDADGWWHALPPQRRVQIHLWIERPAHAPCPGQGALPLDLPDREETP